MTGYDLEIDCRTIDLTNEAHAEYLKSTINEWISEGKKELQKVTAQWDQNEKYYESQQVPPGFSDDSLAIFQAENNPTKILKDENNVIYFQKNEIREIIDGTIGEYTNAKKEVQSTPKQPKYFKIAQICNKIIKDQLHESKFFEELCTPAIEGMVKNGLRWLEVRYNPRKKLPLGDIEIDIVNERDVIVDPDSRLKYFSDRMYDIRIKKIELGEAKKYLAKFGINPDEIRSDTEWRDTDTNKDYSGQKDYVTLYFVEYKKTYEDSYTGEAAGFEQTIEEAEGIEEKDYYFKAIYNTALGCVYHAVNPYGRFSRVPFFNKNSDLQLYPRGDIEFLIKLNDIYNIINSLVLDNARKVNRDKFAIKSEAYEKNAAIVNDFLANGGIIPLDDPDRDIRRLEYDRLPQEFMNLLQITRDYLQEAGYRHDAQKGDYPKEMMSGKAINLLQIQGRRVQNHKDINISWATSAVAEIMFAIIAKEYTSAHFVKAQDEPQGSVRFIPVATEFTMPKYIEFIKQQGYEIQKFEEENDVNYVTPKGINPEMAGYYTLVVVNPLDEEAEIGMRVEFDFNADRDKEFKQTLSLQLRSSGDLSRVDLYKALDMPNAAELLANLEKENEVMSLGTLVARNPQLKALVQQAVSKMQEGNAQQQIEA